jgi:uncharacterized protein (TIGR02328 family)
MRLWHEKLLSFLPRQQLLGQHRECSALRGNSWGKKHSVVNYVFKYDRQRLYDYHTLVMKEMNRRGFVIRNNNWWDCHYRGQNCVPDSFGCVDRQHNGCVYDEHDDDYLNECLDNLLAKGINLKDQF